MMVKKDREGGFSLLELAVAMLLIVILFGLVVLAVTGFFGSARESAMEADLHTVKTAVDAYITHSFRVPTDDGKLPPRGEYAPIDFDASFTEGGRTLTFYPHFLAKLPQHHDEGVWWIDSEALVSLDMEPDQY